MLQKINNTRSELAGNWNACEEDSKKWQRKQPAGYAKGNRRVDMKTHGHAEFSKKLKTQLSPACRLFDNSMVPMDMRNGKSRS
ncbi:hypothetical protein DdX_03096 [Ditylenchus destructor]|uniref:Uncharacterized protein n=1 Tax=Ditylenchus destructor TaxID=166010 RepID=A0AAD4RCQ2_9BILA|nr:hypothetical protein DdX_03096 [Ditylenchus destructor]